MPIFEYQCKSCHQEFEEVVFSNDEIPTCPHCKSEKTERLLSVPCKSYGDQKKFATHSTPTSSGCKGCVGGNCSACGS